MVNFQPYFKYKSMIFSRIFLIFLWFVKVSYNIYYVIQTSNCVLVIFSALLCNFQRLKSEVFFLLILKCVDAFVRTLMMIRTCILVQIVGQCAVGTTNQLIALKRYMSKNSEVFSWGNSNFRQHNFAKGSGTFCKLLFQIQLTKLNTLFHS